MAKKNPTPKPKAQPQEVAKGVLVITPDSTTHSKETFHVVDSATGEHMHSQICVGAQEARESFKALFPDREVKFRDEHGISLDALVRLNMEFDTKAKRVSTKDTLPDKPERTGPSPEEATTGQEAPEPQTTDEIAAASQQAETKAGSGN